MHKILRFAGVLALTACGGDGGGPGITDPEITFAPPAASELVREAIPYDSLGGTTIYFHRWLGGNQNGYVRLAPATRSVAVFSVYGTGFSTAVSPSSNLMAYWEWESLSSPANPGDGRDGIFARPLGSPKSAAVRLSSAERRLRASPAWSPDGRLLYYLEESATQGISRVMRQSPVPDAADRTAMITLPRSCTFQRSERALAIASSGDVAISQATISPTNQCIQQVLRWRATDQSLTVLADFPGRSPLPAWSPDGSRLAVMTGSLGRRQIRIMNADGSNATVIHDAPATGGGVASIDDSICWSGDGSRVVFSSYTAHSIARVWAIRPDGTGLTAITSPVASSPTAGAPEIAADGTLSCTP